MKNLTISNQTKEAVSRMKGMEITEADIKKAENAEVREGMPEEIEFNKALKEAVQERYNSMFEGTEKQIGFAKRLILDVYVPAKERLQLLEKKGRQDHPTYKRYSDLINSVDATWNAGEIINLLNNF